MFRNKTNHSLGIDIVEDVKFMWFYQYINLNIFLTIEVHQHNHTKL